MDVLTPQLTEDELSLFADLTDRYFEKTVQAKVEFRPGEIRFGAPEFLAYTGIIRISGPWRGYVYLSMTHEFLGKLLAAVGETDDDASLARDYIGEIASTIASNARAHFGAGLRISTPIAMNPAEAAAVEWPFSRFSLPFSVLGQTSHLVITLEGN